MSAAATSSEGFPANWNVVNRDDAKGPDFGDVRRLRHAHPPISRS